MGEVAKDVLEEVKVDGKKMSRFQHLGNPRGNEH